jgi:hypothetical protein
VTVIRPGAVRIADDFDVSRITALCPAIRSAKKMSLWLPNATYWPPALINIVPSFEEDAEFYTMQNALSWRLDSIARSEIEARLASYGFDQHSVSMETYVQARETFVLFENLLNTAQTKRLVVLKEIKHHRALGTMDLKYRKTGGQGSDTGN